MDPLEALIFGLPLLVIILLIAKFAVGGGAYVSNSKRQTLESKKARLDSRIKTVEQEIRELDRRIAEFESHKQASKIKEQE